MSKATDSFATLLQSFFTDFMVRQRALSPCTIAAYRDSFCMLLSFAQVRIGKKPAQYSFEDLTPAFISDFLDHLERDRGNSVRSRNARLAAIRSFLNFAASRQIDSLHLIQRALAIPMKRFDRPMLGFLSRELMLALLNTSTETWLGQRDRLLLSMLYNTGARALCANMT